MSNEISYQGTYIGETVKERLLNNSSIYENYDLPANSSITVPILKEENSSSQKHLLGESVESSKDDFTVILKGTPKIQFDENIKKKILKSDSFQRFISEIENRIFSFKDNYKLSLSAKVQLKKDWEIEEFRNIILLIRFDSIPFKEELKLWKMFTFFVREGFKISEDNMNSKELVKDFIKYNNTFYIKLDLT